MGQNFSKHRLVVALSALALAFVLGGFGWAYLALRGLGRVPLILHFSDAGGITSVGGWNTVVFMGVFGLLASAMNFFIALEFDARGRFFGVFAAAMALVFSILLFIAFAAIINANVY